MLVISSICSPGSIGLPVVVHIKLRRRVMAEKVKGGEDECRDICYNEHWVGLEQEVVDPAFEEKYQKCIKQCEIKPGS